jgi:hypothetical protein
VPTALVREKSKKMSKNQVSWKEYMEKIAAEKEIKTQKRKRIETIKYLHCK